jgi:hypothetical protein
MFLYNNSILFIIPSKTGSTSLEGYFSELSNDNPNSHNFKRIKEVFGHSAVIPNGYKNLKRKILLIRNPYERLASISDYYHSEKDLISPYFIEKFKIIRNDIKKEIYQHKNDRLLKDEVSEEMVDTFLKEKERYKDIIENMNRKQKVIFNRTLGEIYTISNPSNIIRIEYIVEDLEKLNIHIDKDKFPHYNKTKNKASLSLKDIFNTQEKIDFANEYFDCAKDAVRFGYKPILTLKDLVEGK